MLTITDLATKKILELIKAEQQEGLALRVSITGRGPGGFQNELQFVGVEDRAPDDVVVEGDGFQVFIDPRSAENLSGATIDYVQGLYQSGFKITNPNPLWSDPRAQAVQEVIDSKINPGVAGHGGFVTLLDVKEETAFIALGGGCQGCGMADVTLKQG
ncbi:MAG TPA: iron-sulfur cluster assembly accessory protein, partial [Candidatus Polarisedimenticolia bacterium]|nr:iron-sulfur cluster assembly accessory protein [Candidatus Polarisedimenticolia bacterium]